MREHTPTMTSQNTERNDAASLIRLADGTPDGLAWWAEQYFRYAVTASPVSQQVQRRDLACFLQFMRAEERTDRRPAWTPRLSSAAGKPSSPVPPWRGMFVLRACIINPRARAADLERLVAVVRDLGMQQAGRNA